MARGDSGLTSSLMMGFGRFSSTIPGVYVGDLDGAFGVKRSEPGDHPRDPTNPVTKIDCEYQSGSQRGDPPGLCQLGPTASPGLPSNLAFRSRPRVALLGAFMQSERPLSRELAIG